MSDKVIHVSDKSFQLEVLESNIPVVVDFWAEWCQPCLALGPTLEEIAEERMGKVKICKVNVEENPELASRFNIRNIPFMAFIKNGQKVADMVGNQPKQNIMKQIDSLIG